MRGLEIGCQGKGVYMNILSGGVMASRSTYNAVCWIGFWMGNGVRMCGWCGESEQEKNRN